MEGDADEFFEEPVGDLLLFQLIGDVSAYPVSSLMELSGDAALADPSFRSGLMLRVARAWKLPLPELNCGQVRVLVSQGLGLPWLAAPVAVFLRERPSAECDLYPGDLMWAALSVHADLLRFAPVETRTMLAGDFGWMDEAFSRHRDAWRQEALGNLAAGRRETGLI